jgi:hypothetical protein
MAPPNGTLAGWATAWGALRRRAVIPSLAGFGTAVLTTVGGCAPKAGTTGSATDIVAACPMAQIRVIAPQ